MKCHLTQPAKSDMETSRYCQVCKSPLLDKGVTVLECGCAFHPRCIHTALSSVGAFCPICKERANLCSRWDLGDDVDVDLAQRKRHPNQVTVTFPKGEVRRSLFHKPCQTRFLLRKSPRDALRHLVANFEGSVLRKDYGLKASAFAEEGFTFEEFLSYKDSREDALKQLSDMDCTARDLYNMGFVPLFESEDAFLEREMRLFPEEIDFLRGEKR